MTHTKKMVLTVLLAGCMLMLIGCTRQEQPQTANVLIVSQPTEVPTSVPTSEPTAIITSVPTSQPTEVPTEVPTSEPSEVPTEVPTSEPTSAPTAVPTSQPTNTPTVVPTTQPTPTPIPSPTFDGNVPHDISDLSEISIWDIDKPSFMDLGGGYTYTCIDIGEYQHFTKIEGNGNILVLMGYFYYEPELDLIIPFEIEGGYFSFGVRPTEDGFILYGRATGEAENVLVMDPILDGNPNVYLYTERIYIGMYGEEYYDVSVAVPEIYQGIEFDVQAVAESPFGYLPGQSGTMFYLNFEPCNAVYYTFEGEVYTQIQCLNAEKEIWAKGAFLYDASRHLMSCNEADIIIKFDISTGCFKVYAGGISGIYGNYQMNNSVYWLGENGISLVHDSNYSVISLHDFEGIPLIMW